MGLQRILAFTAVAAGCALLAFLPMSFLLKILLFIAVLVLFTFIITKAYSSSQPDDWSLAPDALPDAIIVTNMNGKLLFANKLAKDMFPDFATAGTTSELFDGFHNKLTDRSAADDVVAAALAAPDFQFTETLHFNDGQVFERITRIQQGENQRVWILRNISHLQQANHDNEMHTSMVEADAARTAELAEQLYLAKNELEAHQAELTRLANTDSLTSLYNRRRFTALGEEAVKNSTTQNLCVVMMDIDHFKRINDTYGHAAGDVAIRDFAALAKEAVGEAGFVGRMGGEEFAVVLEDTVLDDAIKIAETIRRTTAANVTLHEAEKFRFTISIGVACWFKGEITIEAALDRSDQALYSAKSFGRNRVVGYETASVA